MLYKLITKIICKFKLIVWPHLFDFNTLIQTKSGKTTINLDLHMILVINLLSFQPNI